VTALTLVAALVTVMVPSAPAAGAPGDTVGTITEFDFPTPGGSASVAPGPDGNMWFTKGSANQIGRITVPRDQGRLRGQGGGSIQEITVPTPGSEPSDIVAGPDGAIWFTEFRASQIGRLDLTTGTITEFPIPNTDLFFDIFTQTLTTSTGPRGITVGPDGNLWFAQFNASRVGRITPEGEVTQFPTPTPNSRPVGITAGPDGNLWFTEPVGNKIGRITTEGVIDEFPLPTPNSRPIGITLGLDGALWFAEYLGNKIGRIDPETGAITEIDVPTAGSGPNFIDVGGDGALWFTESFANQIGRLDPVTGTITEFTIPTPGSFPHGIAALTSGVWFTEIAGEALGRVEVCGDKPGRQRVHGVNVCVPDRG
jgi:virginiamycin B lyase